MGHMPRPKTKIPLMYPLASLLTPVPILSVYPFHQVQECLTAKTICRFFFAFLGAGLSFFFNLVPLLLGALL